MADGSYEQSLLFLLIKMRERRGKGMGGTDEGCEWTTTLGRERERERERSNADRANVPANVHAALGAQRPTPMQEACLCYL